MQASQEKQSALNSTKVGSSGALALPRKYHRRSKSSILPILNLHDLVILPTPRAPATHKLPIPTSSNVSCATYCRLCIPPSKYSPVCFYSQERGVVDRKCGMNTTEGGHLRNNRDGRWPCQVVRRLDGVHVSGYARNRLGCG